MQAIVDRIEGNVAVIEYEGKMYDVEINIIDGIIHEGDVVDIKINKNKIVSVRKNEIQTTLREKHIKEITKDMWE